MQNTLKEQGKYLVTVSDPHLKVDENFSVHLEADSKDFYVKSLEQIPFVGKCWPGDSSWPDFINPEVRKY